MKFRSRSDYSRQKPKAIVYPKTRPQYIETVDKEGKRKVVKDGETNFYLQAQEALSDTLIYNLIDQYERTGNASIFGSPSLGGFIDTVGMPRDLMEAENIRARAKMLFDALPLEERKKFGHDFGAFLNDVNAKLAAKSIAQAQSERQKVKDEAAGAAGGN